MAIRQADIINTPDVAVLRKSLNEAQRDGSPTAFLSHSHKDAHLASRVQRYLNSKGWEVYIDWQDHQMPEQPSAETADRIQKRIRDLTLFLYLATANSSASRWCPWELGYADGVKKRNRVLILPTSDATGAIYGNEYLQLYRHVDTATGGGIGHFDAGSTGYLLTGRNLPGV